MEPATGKLKVVAAFIEARGVVSEAARIAGVSKQRVYEVLSRLRGSGFRFRGYPSLAALGRVLLAISHGSRLPGNEVEAMRLSVYTFGGGELSIGIYVVPQGIAAADALRDLSGFEIVELLDVIPAAPWRDVPELRPREGDKLPSTPRRELDEIDRAILAKLYEDVSAPVSSAVPGAGRSLLSYHFRQHVKPLLRVLLDTHPVHMHARPLLLAEARAESEEWLASLLRARQVYLLMPRLDRLSAYALLDVENPFEFLKKVAEARRERGLGLRLELLGYVDPERSEKPKIPSAFAPGHRVEAAERSR